MNKERRINYVKDKETALAKAQFDIADTLEEIRDIQKNAKPAISLSIDPEKTAEVLKNDADFLADVKGDKGDKGDSPTDDEITALIAPLIPDPIPGKDGADGAVGPRGPAGRDGESIVGPAGKDGKDGKDGSPDTAEEVRDKLTSLEGDDRLDFTAIKGLEKLVKNVKGKTQEFIVGGIRYLKDLADARVSSPTDGQVLTYDATLKVWKNADASGGGTWGSITGTLSDQTDLQTALNAKATPADITTAINNLVDTAPGTLDTLNELAAALGDDANFATTVTTALAGKAPTVHTHTASQITDFDTEVSNNTDVAANTAARHTHSNSAVLNATTASFTTADETKLDYISITQAVDLDAIETASHSHSNKALLDTYTQTEANLADAVAKKHAHANQAVLDATTASFLTADETKLDGIEAGADVTDATNVAAAGAFMKSSDDTDDITEGATNKFATAAEKTKLGYITVTQAVDLDTIESDTATNNAKVTNATHTGEVTGATTLTVDKTAITGKSAVTADAADYVLISDTSDSGNLKKALVSDFGGGSSDHGALSGLSDDDHTQYALLAGRSGGQTIIGGTGTTDDLTLQTTSGVGTTGADMHFLVGNNGATEAMTILNSGYVGLNTNAPPSRLVVNGNSGTIPTLGSTANSVFHGIGPNSGAANINLDTFAGVPQINLRRSNGTLASPSTVSAADTVGLITWLGYNGSAYLSNSVARIGAVATENYSTTAAGTRLEFRTQANGSVAGSSLRMVIDQSGNIGLGGITAPTQILSISGQSARTINLERHTTSNTAGNSLTIQSGGATSGATDKNGGNLILSSGTSTGTGESTIELNVYKPTSSGTSDATQVNIGSYYSQGFRVKPHGTSAGETGKFEFMELAANGTNSVSLKAPDAITSSTTYTLPSADGSSGQFLKTDGSGTLSWDTAGGGSSTAIDSTTGSWWNMQIPPSTALASGTPTYTGIIEYSAASDGQALQWYLPSIQGGTSDKMIFSDVKRVIARLYYRRTSGTSLMGFGFADQGSYVGDAVATAGIRACFTWTDASTLYAVTSDGAGTPTSTSITSPPTSGNWNEYIVDYDKTNSSAKFYVNGTLKATHTTELPADGSSCRFVIGVGGSVAGSFSYPIISIKQL